MGEKQFYVPVKTGLLWNNWVCIYVYKNKKKTGGGLGGREMFK